MKCNRFDIAINRMTIGFSQLDGITMIIKRVLIIRHGLKESIDGVNGFPRERRPLFPELV